MSQELIELRKLAEEADSAMTYEREWTEFKKACTPAAVISLLDQIDALKAENERLKERTQILLNDCNTWAQEVKKEQRLSFRDERDALKAENERLKAEREALRDSAKEVVRLRDAFAAKLVPLTKERITELYNEACADWKNRYDRPVVFARAIEAAILAKLASAELPEPIVIDRHESGIVIRGYTADQLRQAYAQGAASQLSAEPVYQYQMGDGSWIDQQRHSYYYNRLHAPNAVVRIVFTLKEPK